MALIMEQDSAITPSVYSKKIFFLLFKIKQKEYFKMSEKNNNEIKPSTFILDNKDAAYYRNLFCNVVRNQSNYCTRCINAINTICNNIDQMINSDEKRDPNTDSYKETYNSWKNLLGSISDEIKHVMEKLTKDYVMLKSKDYEEILEAHAKKIRESEISLNNREITTYEVEK